MLITQNKIPNRRRRHISRLGSFSQNFFEFDVCFASELFTSTFLCRQLYQQHGLLGRDEIWFLAHVNWVLRYRQLHIGKNEKFAMFSPSIYEVTLKIYFLKFPKRFPLTDNLSIFAFPYFYFLNIFLNLFYLFIYFITHILMTQPIHIKS